MKTECTTSDSAHPVVDPLDWTVCQPEIDVGEDAVAVLPDRACDAKEGTEPRAARPAEPFLGAPDLRTMGITR